MCQTPAEEKIARAQQSLYNVIWLIEWGDHKLLISEAVRYEILRMLRFYQFAVSDKGATPEASAERALAYIDSLKQWQWEKDGAITPSPPPQNS